MEHDAKTCIRRFEEVRKGESMMKENYVYIAEFSVEQNDNMLDGILKNNRRILVTLVVS